MKIVCQVIRLTQRRKVRIFLVLVDLKEPAGVIDGYCSAFTWTFSVVIYQVSNRFLQPSIFTSIYQKLAHDRSPDQKNTKDWISWSLISIQIQQKKQSNNNHVKQSLNTITIPENINVMKAFRSSLSSGLLVQSTHCLHAKLGILVQFFYHICFIFPLFSWIARINLTEIQFPLKSLWFICRIFKGEYY